MFLFPVLQVFWNPEFSAHFMIASSAMQFKKKSAASKHLERLLEGCCMEIFVRNTNPDSQLHFIRKFAKNLVIVFAFHLAETISACTGSS